MIGIMVLAIASIVAPAAATRADPSTAGGTENGRIAFQRASFSRESVSVYSVNPDGTGLRRLTHPRRGAVTALADWSPNGRRIVYQRGEWGAAEIYHIFVMRADGSHRVDLTQGRCRAPVCGSESSPTWSPHGHRIAFHRWDRSGQPSIYVMRHDGTHRRQVTRPSHGYGDYVPSWSPDASRLVFVRWSDERSVSAIFTVRLDGTGVRRITPWKLDASELPEWSPDGRWIMFQSHKHDGALAQVCLIHPNGTGFREVVDSPDSWTTGSFSPDGTMITAIRYPGEASENDVYTMDLDGTHISPVTDALSIPQAEGAPDWGPARR
jgi:TolB protein